ncbi:MAG: glycerol-3-phosphate 1-O-acyltransferase PlsY [Candidatus Omnitrophica bacterium]|nr:glycerol-3-phosphate 1-O-acyltransferase PlsY [Candidatus Omnitrophota bacterium]MBU1047532.1 glycerol-3-phosphate 1-O-acyltransferase PlsY [Candidatus Omnitrophota bacterium]MBU1630612.1 glycerol-3-phosphate 1-O-acyltransferase PlsY [Candidatus Omnitrophota bacterium]MBU1767354.1 glycerol-3-phosphate 1-O-acyltransferase PlsY [Candidatus Omnitrophota bacterium]MBU1888895.1 glycerol-3-phosphate 1-O-acyltransferase PlsY [Candidatus Omnitrophota bacterium]
MSLILVIIVGYLLGSLPFSFWLGKARGIDLRRVGSGNIGATNLARVLDARWGFLAFILDGGKGFLAVFLAGYISTFFTDNIMSVPMLKITGGIISILGHNWSIWVKFKGGKGVATSAGVFVGLAPITLLIVLGIWVAVFIPFGYVSLASLVAAISLPILMLAGIGGKVALPIIIFSCIVTVLIIIRHRLNIKRLIQGRENKFGRRR